MKAHMAHINNTLIRKQLAEEATNEQKHYIKYVKQIDDAYKAGFTRDQIIACLEEEKVRIKHDEREGDPIFQTGLSNSKVSCTSAINLIIRELKGEGK